jgi:phosphoglycerol transferase MdoB-like AlkP superfamily enzyme
MHQKYSALYFPFKLIIFYLVGLNLWRFVFIFHNDNSDIFLPAFHGFKLDLSMTCGAMLITFIPWILYLVFGKGWLLSVCKWISCTVWILVCLVEFGSVLIYPEWGTTLDARAIGYLNHFGEAWASSKDFISWKVGFFGLLILFVGLKRLLKLFEHWQPVRSSYLQSAVFLVLIGPLLFLGLRGGLQKLPIKPSDAFYGKDMKNNFAAVNKVWYLLYSLKHQTEMNILHSDSEIELFLKEYKNTTSQQDTFEFSLKNKNIVVIITEGWSADLVRYMGGREKITPFFDSISDKSIRFTNAFSTGFRTDQGLMSILSGIPSVASLNMPNQLDKVMKYPSIVQDFKNAGYKTSFVYGGDLNFSNLYNYLTIAGFDTIIRDKSFASADDITDWGVPDHIMIQKAKDISNQLKEPFFSTILLMSSHAPFDIPIPNEFSGKPDTPSKYKASVKYSDHALQMYFDSVRTQSWFANTVFILTSDHGSTHSGYAGMDDHDRFRIPFIIYEPGKNLRRQHDNVYTSFNHYDIPYTLAYASGFEAGKFIFGRNIFCADSTRYAYWNTDNVAAYYSLQSGEVVPSSLKNNRATLFTDLVRKWFNNLSK